MGGVFKLLKKEMSLAEKPFLQGEGVISVPLGSDDPALLTYANFTKILLMVLLFNTM